MFLIYIIVLTLLLLASYFIFNAWINPFTVIAVPFYVIAMFVMSIGQNMGYFPISDSALMLILIGLSLFWVGCLASYFITHINVIRRNYNYEVSFDYGYLDLSMYIAGFMSLSASIILYSLAFLKLGIGAFGTEEIAEIVARGPLAHVRLMGYPAIMYFSIRFLDRPKLRYIFIVLLLLLSYFGTMVKYHIIMPLLATLFFIVFLRPKKTKKVLLISIISICIIFICNYMYNFKVMKGTLTSSDLIWAINHMIDYIVGGPIALGIYLDSIPYGLEQFSFSSLFFPTLPSLVTSLFAEKPQVAWLVNINKLGGMNNTGTLFWSLYFFCGWAGVIMWSIIFGCFTSVLYFYAKIKNTFVRVGLLAHIMAILTLTFFGDYFTLWAPWEYAFWIVSIPLIGKMAFKKNRLKISNTMQYHINSMNNS